jgi:sporulation protein YlmC with PRC-barrel domain
VAHYGTLGDYRFSDTQEAASDIRGAKVYGPNNEQLGNIDDVVFDRASGAIVYVVIDTGGWFSSNKFIVPPTEIRPSVQHEQDFLVDLTKEQIESLPAYDGKALNSEEKWDEYERWYRSKWEEDPIMHRAATDRNITPTTKQQVHAGSGAIPAVWGTGTASSAGTGSPDPRMVASDKAGLPEDQTLEELEDETEITSLHPEVELDASPNMPSYRWSTFEDTLRRRRDEVLRESIDNAKRADRESQSVHKEERRKAS